jgi:hypothetical protein
MDSGHSAKHAALKIKWLAITKCRAEGQKKGGPKMKVSLTMLLKTNGEKMSPSSLETMSLETHALHNSETMLMKMKVVSSQTPATGMCSLE